MSETPGPAIGPLLEERLDDLYEHAPCGYVSALPDGTIARVNETFLEWTGYTRAELVGVRRFQDLLTPGGRIYHETHYAPLLRMQGSVRGIALQIRRPDGSRLPVLINSILRRAKGGDETVVRTTVFDASDRHAYEQELLRARRRETELREHLERLQQLTQALAVALDAPAMAAATADAAMDVPGVSAARIEVGGEELERRGEPADGWTDDVALATGQRTVGRLQVASADGGEAERAFLLACAGQCAQALERAQLYEHEHRVADGLQRSMLTRPLPQDPRFVVTAYYRPALELMAVGGDWYDAFPLPDGRFALVVGDVVGRGIEAASAMGQLRSAVRALAGGAGGPARLLERLDEFVEHAELARSATLVHAELDADAGRLRFACAGHPPPVLLEPDGAGGLRWEARSPPLGAFPGIGERPEAEVAVAPGARLFMYTDGLVERRDRPIDAGLDRLVAALRAAARAPLEELVATLPDALLRGVEIRDDVCLLGVALA